MRLVDDDRAPAPVLDDDALPAGWEAWITTEAAATACPRDYVAAALIGAASACIGEACGRTSKLGGHPQHGYCIIAAAIAEIRCDRYRADQHEGGEHPQAPSVAGDRG
jgi:hypothetical protein